MFQPPLLASDLMSDRSPEAMRRELDRANLDLKLRQEASARTRKRVIELEAELRDSSRVSAKQPATLVSAHQIQSNLKSDRQAAYALAQHDSVLINDLEKEVRHLQGKREKEQKLNAELIEKVAVLMKTLESKEMEIQTIRETCRNKDNLIEVLEAKTQKQDEVMTSLLKTRLSPEKDYGSESWRNGNFMTPAESSGSAAIQKLKPVKYVTNDANKNFFSPLGSTHNSPTSYAGEWADMVS